MTNADKFKQIFGLYATELWSKTEGEFLVWLNSDFNQSDVLDTNVGDTISRQAAIDEMEQAKQQYFDRRVIIGKMQDIVNNLPSAQPEQQWIPCSERLPEEDVEVLISYRYKEGEGDTSHTNIDITTYGQMYFGGKKVGNYKHWRPPFEYFESNYEVVAWMPLPEPYKGEES